MNIKSLLVTFISTELPESYNGLKVILMSTPSKGRPVTFMDSSLRDKAQNGREILVLEELGKMSVKPPKMVLKARDTSKYCEFHQDYGHDTNSCRELKNQIDKAVKSGKLAHFIKGIRKGMAKQTETQLGE
ncbi:hypothetical protein Tco_1465804 [Tanacetum coccineum]